MPIYSKNRSGSMALDTVKVENSYGMHNSGRVLYEAVMNEKTLFDCMIANDMNEIKGIKEGTILESEVESLNEATIKELVNKIKDGILKFWAKLKQIFKDAMNKIAAYVMGDCKAFALEFKKFAEKHPDSKATIDGTFPKVDYELVSKMTSAADFIGKRITKARFGQDIDITPSTIIAEELKKTAGADFGMDPSGFKNHVIENLASQKLNGVNKDHKIVADMIENCEKGLKYTIGRVKNAQANAESAVNSMLSLQDSMLKDNEKTYEENYQKLVTLVNANQQYISTVCTTAIAVEKHKFTAARKALGALMAAMRSEASDAKKDARAEKKAEKKARKALNDAAINAALVEASIEIDTIFSDTMFEASVEVKEFIDSVDPTEVLA